MNVRELLIDYLKEFNYDGLYNSEYGCGCVIDDFAPCDGISPDYCAPGFKVLCRCGEGCDWDIAATKDVREEE